MCCNTRIIFFIVTYELVIIISCYKMTHIYIFRFPLAAENVPEPTTKDLVLGMNFKY